MVEVWVRLLFILGEVSGDRLEVIGDLLLLRLHFVLAHVHGVDEGENGFEV